MLLSRFCIAIDIEDVGLREYSPQSLSSTSFRFELILRTAVFANPVSLLTPPLARIGASVDDFFKERSKLP